MAADHPVKSPHCPTEMLLWPTHCGPLPINPFMMNSGVRGGWSLVLTQSLLWLGHSKTPQAWVHFCQGTSSVLGWLSQDLSFSWRRLQSLEHSTSIPNDVDLEAKDPGSWFFPPSFSLPPTSLCHCLPNSLPESLVWHWIWLLTVVDCDWSVEWEGVTWGGCGSWERHSLRLETDKLFCCITQNYS